MSFHIVTEPLDRWPLPDTKNRPWPPFSAGHKATMDLLYRELRAIAARGPVVLQVVTRNGTDDLRRDGALRAQAKIEHPGVRLSFECKHGPLTYATDAFGGTYNRPAWQQNLRAIALGLEALRKVDRYGISRSGEQYRGWRAIEAGTGAEATALTVEQALDLIAKFSDAEENPDVVRSFPREQIRLAKAKAHPDRNGGDRAAWDLVEQAVRVLARAGIG